MAIKAYRIKGETLRKIANAIRKVRGIQGKIPTSELANAYMGKAITVTAPEGNSEEFIIYEQTLVELADAIRSKDGTTAKILVSDLEAKILNSAAIKRLATPIIRLVEGDENIPEGYTPAILGIAILGRTILGKTEASNLPRLAKPIIDIVEDDEGIRRLATPRISLVEVAEMLKLDTPIIELVDVGEELPDVPDEPIIPQLDTPTIILVVEEEEPDIPDVPELEKLGTPIIDLVIEEEEIPELIKLDTPVIELVGTGEDAPEIVLFEADVVTKSAAINGGTWGSTGTILTEEHLLAFNTLGYIVAINDSEYVLDTQLRGDDNDGGWENNATNYAVRIYQGWEGTAINSALLGAEGTVNHIKIYYREGDLNPAEVSTVSTYGLRREVPEMAIWGSRSY